MKTAWTQAQVDAHNARVLGAKVCNNVGINNDGTLKLINPKKPARIEYEANLSADITLPDSKSCEREETLEADSQGEAQGAGLPHCCFTLIRKKLLDVDAKYASVKDLLDCLTISKCIRGDKEGQISLEVQQRKCEKGEQEKEGRKIEPTKKLDKTKPKEKDTEGKEGR